MSGKEPEIRLEITPPDKNAPGFLKRQHTLVQFMHKLDQAERSKIFDPDLFSDMVEFLADFVVEPKDREKAKDVLWSLSEVQYLEIMEKVQSGGDLVPPTKESP